MVPERAVRKVLDRIVRANRLGLMAEASGLQSRLCGFAPDPMMFSSRSERMAYLRGYREAGEIIAVESELARPA